MKGASTRKTSRPSLRDVLPRQRLFAALATAKPVAWLTAPPGAGKTTLAASYTEHVATSTWWYQLDSDDIDPATFFHGMRQLASKVSAAKAARLPAFPAQGGVDLAVFARRFFRLLFPLLPAGAIWVIDGYQEAEGASLAVILREAFEEFPPGCSALTLSLVGPPAELARLVANGVIRLLDAADLRFTRAESDDLVLSRVVVEPAVLFDIHESRQAGWRTRADDRAPPPCQPARSARVDDSQPRHSSISRRRSSTDVPRRSSASSAVGAAAARDSAAG